MKNLVTIVGLLFAVQFLGAGSCGGSSTPATTGGAVGNAAGAVPNTNAVGGAAGAKTGDAKVTSSTAPAGGTVGGAGAAGTAAGSTHSMTAPAESSAIWTSDIVTGVAAAGLTAVKVFGVGAAVLPAAVVTAPVWAPAAVLVGAYAFLVRGGHAMFFSQPAPKDIKKPPMATNHR